MYYETRIHKIYCMYIGVFIGYMIWEKSFPTVFQTTLDVTKSKRREYSLKEHVSFKCDEIEKILYWKI